MASRVGGHMPDDYGLSMTVLCPTASEANPIEKNTPLVFTTTGAYHVKPAAAGDTVQAIAKHRIIGGFDPLGVHAFGWQRVSKVAFSGTAPAIGASVEADGAGAFRAAATANGTRVMYVDAAGGFCEVAFP